MDKHLDQDLEEMSKGVSSQYHSEREPAIGRAQIYVIQAIRNLQVTIQSLDTQNSKLQKKMFWLTVVTLILASVQIFPIISTILK